MTGDDPSTKTRESTLRISVEVIFLFACTVLGIRALNQLGGLHPLLLENVQALAALMFIGLPLWILRRRRIDAHAFGIRFDGLRTQTKKAAIVALVVFPVFLIGNHLVEMEFRGRTLALDDHVVWRWPLNLQNRPSPVMEDEDFTLYAERGVLTVLWSSPGRDAERQITLEFDGPIESTRVVQPRGDRVLEGARCATPITKPSPNILQVHSGCGAGVRVHVGEARHVSLELDPHRDSPKDVRIGAFRLLTDETDFDRTIWWIFELLLIHIIMVGIPEEVFYRGYVQTRLQALFPPRWRLFGVEIGTAVLMTSVLFALGHFLIEFNPWRLMVFFPSLLFGWVRNWTGVIGAAAIVHGLSNVLQQVVLGMYAG
jgi:membrane protease YdiL (CAAX protease family)